MSCRVKLRSSTEPSQAEPSPARGAVWWGSKRENKTFKLGWMAALEKSEDEAVLKCRAGRKKDSNCTNRPGQHRFWTISSVILLSLFWKRNSTPWFLSDWVQFPDWQVNLQDDRFSASLPVINNINNINNAAAARWLSGLFLYDTPLTEPTPSVSLA